MNRFLVKVEQKLMEVEAAARTTGGSAFAPSVKTSSCQDQNLQYLPDCHTICVGSLDSWMHSQHRGANPELKKHVY